MEELVGRLRESLENNAWVKDFKIEVVPDGMDANLILLSGITSTFHQKQQAQEQVRRVIEAEKWSLTIENRIIVR